MLIDASATSNEIVLMLCLPGRSGRTSCVFAQYAAPASAYDALFAVLMVAMFARFGRTSFGVIEGVFASR